MKVKEVPIGAVFNIENTPSYPKLKLKQSYIDMRDRIYGTPSITDEKEAYIMDNAQLCKQFDAAPDEIHAWIGEINSYVLKSR